MSARRIILWLILALLLTGGLYFILAQCLLAFEKDPAWPVKYKDYVVTPAENFKEPALSLKPLPDLSEYTTDNILRKIPTVQPGVAEITIMKDITGFDKFTETRRINEFSKLQGRISPQAIIVSSGVYDLETLTQTIDNPSYISKDNGAFNLHVPIYIDSDATLEIKGTHEDPVILRLSANTGGFLVNAGKLFIVDAEVSGWDFKKNSYAAFKRNKTFRPFITTWSGAETYFGRASFYDLGYAASKSYGITFSSSAALLKRDSSMGRSKGWIVESRFERIYYGFYCYEADDIAIVNNVYFNNIVYGIDPHDRSNRLIIAGNTVHGTQQKHGIIGSRAVNDSWIVNNIAYENGGSGFMLDRSSVRNLVADNISYRNKSDGITLFESSSNLLIDNKSFLNEKNGLRIRNSWDVIADDNFFAFNKGVGVQVYSVDISKTEDDRDFVLDPFLQRAEALIRDAVIAFNTGGGFKFNDTDNVVLSDVEFIHYNRRLVRGDIDDMSLDIAMGLRRTPGIIAIERSGGK